MVIVGGVDEVRRRLDAARVGWSTIGLVPTMGALHAGHGSLIDAARRETDCVVVSIFVNPTQFNQPEDFALYPRTLDTDTAFCEARGADIVFAPSVEEMYPKPQQSIVDVNVLTDRLCGKFRPGHFRGVATVVLKLLNIVQPHRAYFGEKDAQQLALIRRMVEDLMLPVSIVAVPTVREADGLAMSSRNVRLNSEERRSATVLYAALRHVEDRIRQGAADAAALTREALEIFAREPGVRVEYFEIVDPGELQPVERIASPVLVATAAWVGATRLIDNILCRMIVPR